MSSRHALAAALAAAALAAACVWSYYGRHPQHWSDFDQIWLGVRALLGGRDPYAAVRASWFPWPLYYPGPALVLGLPFAPLPLPVARVAFGALSAAALAWTFARYRPHALPFLLSGPVIHAIQRCQWSPLLVVGVLVPVLGGVLAAKPSIGLATFAYRPHRGALIGALAVTVVSLVLLPSWPFSWLATIGTASHLIVPVLMPGGWLLLLALLRWRWPEARLLVVLASVPQIPTVYELVPLSLVARNLRESLLLTLLWTLVYIFSTLISAEPWRWPLTLALGYLPVLLLILSRPPRP